VAAGVKVGLGPSPSGGRSSSPHPEEEDTGEGPPPILRISLEFTDPDDPGTEGIPPTMSAAPWKSNLPPDLRDALPTASNPGPIWLTARTPVGWTTLTPGKGG